MKAFDQYLAEAEKEFAFRLRVATDLEEGVMDKIENRLKKYEAFSISTPKKTMFQASPPGFSHIPGAELNICLLYTSPSPRDLSTSRMPSSA